MDKLTELIISNVIGLVVGLATSFFSWWVLFHRVVPVIEFAGFISKIPKRAGTGHSYRVKFKNTGRRAIVGVEVFARLVIDWEGNKNWSAVYIPLSRDGDRKVDMPKIGKGFSRVLTFYPNLVEAFTANPRYPEAFRQKAKANNLTMEDVLSLGKETKLRVYVSGYDEFSGSRKVFESAFLYAKDIKDGWFKGVALTDKPSSQPESENGNHVV